MALQHIEVVGRDEELAMLAGLLEDVDGLPRAIVVEGEAGIGKTTVWREGLAVAEGSYRALISKPSEAEAQISFAALGDLLADEPDDALADLPDPQRHALEVALRRADPGDQPPDSGAIAFAFLATLRALAQNRPVLIAVDDAQWLDGPSALVLQYAARRLADDPVALLVAVRSAGAPAVPLGLDRAFPGGRLRTLPVGPLSLGAIQQLLRERLGAALPRPLLRRVHETSGGNPFFALELARALGDARPEPGQDLPVPETLHELVHDRLATLPRSTEQALRAAALLADPRLDLVLQASDGTDRDLEQALEGQIAELSEGRVRFTHPLLAAGALARTPPHEQRKLHLRLAALVEKPEERARHMALGADEADAEVAAQIEKAAATFAPGAPGQAAELFEEAVRLTEPGDRSSSVRRTIAASEAHRAAGDWERARELAVAAVERAPAGDRAAALLQLAKCAEHPVELCEQAFEAAGDDHALRARIGVFLCDYRLLTDLRAALADARAAVEDAEAAGETVLLAEALGMLGFVEAVRLEGDPRRHLERAVELERGVEGVPLYFSAEANLAMISIWPDELDEARERFERVLQEAIERGDEHAWMLAVLHLAQIEWRAGNWEAGAAHAQDGYDAWERSGDAQGKGTLLWAKAVIEAHQGRHDEARAAAHEGLALEIEDSLFGARHRAVLGFCAFAEGLYEEAVSQYSPLPALLDQTGVAEPGFVLYETELAEALIALGKLDEAEDIVASMEERGRALERPRLLATAARCRGLLCGARGDRPGALEAFHGSLAEHERLPVPFERARTVLALGTVQRRAGKRRAARESLQAALAAFEELGAEVWAGRATAELKRIGGRAPSGDELTPSERRIAELVAEGKTNKEVAADLFVTVHTVEQALTRVYRKLGIRSRTQLTRRLAGKV